jgi:hypothetical protein
MFSKNLYEARSLARMSHRTLSEEIKARGKGTISHTTLWQIEKGRRCRPQTKSVIASTFKDIGVIFTEDGLVLSPKINRAFDGRILFKRRYRKKVDNCQH